MKQCDTCIYGNKSECEKPCIVYKGENCELYEKRGDGMTNEEAIKELSEMRTDAWTDSRQMKAFDMAIKALGQEPSGETVSLEAFKQVMWERDIAIEQLKELGYEFGQKIEPCDDAISRQEAIRIAEQGQIQGYEWQFKELNKLPAVNTQEPKMGHWIWNVEKGYCKCSKCGIGMGHTEFDYCPNCGVKMESEDKV